MQPSSSNPSFNSSRPLQPTKAGSFGSDLSGSRSTEVEMTGGSGSGGWSDGDDDDWGSLESAGGGFGEPSKPVHSSSASSNDLLDFGAATISSSKVSSGGFDVSFDSLYVHRRLKQAMNEPVHSIT